MSENVADAAMTACAAPTPDSVFIDSGAGSSRMTMLSQNAVRNRKNMTLPLVLHGVFPAVEATLAEALEGEVGSVLLILRMLEASCLRLFLKFERFSSLRKCRRRGRWSMRIGVAIERRSLNSPCARGSAIRPPGLATARSPFRMNSAAQTLLRADAA